MPQARRAADGVFDLTKDSVFEIVKEIYRIHVGSYWDENRGPGPRHDIDVHLFGLRHIGGDPQNPAFAGSAQWALTYANKRGLKFNPDKSFATKDGLMEHSPDNRRGGVIADHMEADGHGEDEKISEEMMVQLAKLPAEIVELAIWFTIHDPEKLGIDFSMIREVMVEVCDPDDHQLCRYAPTGEFAGMTAIQVASIMRQPDGSWTFHAIGAGSKKTLADILDVYNK